MSEDLEARFKKAVWLIRNGPKQSSSTETKLKFYKYFKQVCRSAVASLKVSAFPWSRDDRRCFRPTDVLR